MSRDNSLIGKDIRHFQVIGNDYISESSLRVGDFFAEDTYPEVYQVTAVNQALKTGNGKRTNYGAVVAKCITDNTCGHTIFNCSNLVLLEPKD